MSGSRFTHEGRVTFSSSGGCSDGVSGSYSQIFHSGAIEAVDAKILRGAQRGETAYIPSVAYERALINGLNAYLVLYRQSGITTPAFVMLSLLGVRGRGIITGNPHHGGRPISIEDLVPPEARVDDFIASTMDTATILRPAFDRVWQACGFPRSMNYDDEGQWVGQEAAFYK